MFHFNEQFFNALQLLTSLEPNEHLRQSNNVSCYLGPCPLLVQADPNRGACLDSETGILVNHAYGLADMKVRDLIMCSTVGPHYCSHVFLFSGRTHAQSLKRIRLSNSIVSRTPSPSGCHCASRGEITSKS